MLIYTHTLTNRCRYIFDLVFGTLLNGVYSLTEDRSAYDQYHAEKLAYTFERPQGGFWIRSTSLLFETVVEAEDPDIIPFAGTKALYATEGDFPFDLFAASFYMVSRYEEYSSFTPDRFGRYPAKASLAYRHRFLETPVVNRWAEELKKSLLQLYPSLLFQRPVFQSVTSFDIDVAYAYQGRSLLYQAAASGREMARGNTKAIKARWEAISGRQQDPYDTYDYIRRLFDQFETTPLFFFLLRKRRTQYDRNIQPASGALHRLIAEIASFSDTGLHPSYYTMDKPALLDQEKARLETISGQKVTKSRQHYLRFRIPDTYRLLEEAGITDDYSMGFAETPGFRAGICTPFCFYDLKQERTTRLKIHPITYMDGSFIEDLGMQPEAAAGRIRSLITEVRKVNGLCISIWHNHTVSNQGPYRGWSQVLEQSLQFTQHF